MKTSELTGAALDWAVAKCQGVEFTYENFPQHELLVYQYSNDWAQGGPIIERERISVEPCFDLKWVAIRTESPNSAFEEEGPTPLIAAMRCHVANKMGNEVEVPDELMEGEEA